MREIPDKVQIRIKKMAKKIAWFHYWTGDKTEMAMDLEQEGLLEAMTNDVPLTDNKALNRRIRTAMVNYLLRWCYGVQNRQSESLKTLTTSINDIPESSNTWSEFFTDSAPSAEECVYVNQVVEKAVLSLAPKCRVLKLSDYRDMVEAMVENSDPYLIEGSRKLKQSATTVSWMKRNIQEAFRAILKAA